MPRPHLLVDTDWPPAARVASRTLLLLLLVLALVPVAAVLPVARASAAPAVGNHTPTIPQTNNTPVSPAVLKAAKAQANTATTPTTASYQLSTPVYNFLTSLGIPLGSSPTVTGKVAGSTITLQVAAPGKLPLTLPKGIVAPAFGQTTVVIDTAANTLTATSSASGATAATLKIVIAHASTSALPASDLAGTVTVTAQLFGQPVTLTGTLTDTSGKGAVSLSGALANPAVLQANTATLTKGTTLTITTAAGLHVAGSATVGTGKASATVNVSGAVADTTSWTLAAAPTTSPWAPLTGFSEAAAFTGSITDTQGVVHFDVTSQTPVSWKPIAGLNASVTRAELADTAAPTSAPAGITNGSAWVSLTGTATADGGLNGSLNAVLDPATGHSAVTVTQTGSVTLGRTPTTVTLDNVLLSGDLAGLTGRGQVHLGSTIAQATVRLSAEGAVVVTFSADLGAVGLGASGTTDSVVWASSTTATSPAGYSLGATATPQKTPLKAPLQAAVPGPNTASGTAPSTPSNGPSSTFTISAAVQQYLAKLGIPVNSTTLTGTLSGSTLTLTVGAPGALPITLPTGDSISFGDTTITVDVSTGELTATATATASNGTAGALTIHIANVATNPLSTAADLTATLDITGLPVLNTTVDLHGSLSYVNGKVAAALSGALTTDAVVKQDILTVQSGSSISLSTADGLTIAGTVLAGSGSAATRVAVNGAIKDLKNWSLTVSTAAGAPSFAPVDGLSITPAFSGTVSDTAGAIGFDLTLSNGLTWQAGSGVTLGLNRVEVSNLAPPSAASCPSGIAAGSVWVDVQGELDYNPAGIKANGEACINPSGRTFTITGSETGAFIPDTAGFTVSDPHLTIQGDLTAKTFSVGASATLTITAASSHPTFAVGLSFANDGSFIAGVQLSHPEQLGLSGLNGELFVSTRAVKGFNPADIGIANVARLDLPVGVTATVQYSLPQNAVTALQQLHIPLNSTTVQAQATLSSSGFSAKIILDFGSGAQGAQVLATNGSYVYLNSVYLGLSLGAGNNSFSIGGSAYLDLAPLYGTTRSPVEVGVYGTISFTPVKISLGFSLAGVCQASGDCAWHNAFGIQDLSVNTVAGNIGLDFSTTPFPTPTLSFVIDNLVLPTSWSNAIGVVAGAQISLAANLDVTQPMVRVSITPGGSNTIALTPLAVATKDQSVIHSLEVRTAQLYFAPLGGMDAAGTTLAPGVTIAFDATVAGVPVHIDGAVTLSPPHITANVHIGDFHVGTLTVHNTDLHVDISTSGFSFTFSGGFTDSFTGVQFGAKIGLTASASLIGGAVTLTVNGGQPAYVQAGATLYGNISVGSSGFQFNAGGYANLIVGGQWLGFVWFSYSTDGGAAWQQLQELPGNVAAAFHNAYGWADWYVAYQLEQLHYSTAQTAQGIQSAFNEGLAAVIQALNWSGVQTDAAVQACVTAFNSTDTQVVAALTANGLSPQQIAATLQNVFHDSPAAIYNAVQQTIGNAGNTVISAISNFFNNGSYNISTRNPAWFPLYMDVSGGSQSPNAGVIQWPWNGGYNQDWYVLPTDSGYAEIVNKNSGQCLSVGWNSQSPGQQLVQYPCYGWTDQQWYLGVYPGNSDLSYQTRMLWSRSSGQVADVTGGSINQGTAIEQWPGTGNWNQQWRFTPAVG